MIVFHPYRPLVEYCIDAKVEKTYGRRILVALLFVLLLHQPGLTSPIATSGRGRVLPTAWNMVNDCFRGDVFLQYPPYLIALGKGI